MDETAGMECFYSAESVRLAATWGPLLPSAPWWNSTTPSVHFAYARNCRRPELMERLLVKYRALLTDPPAASRMEVWTDTTATLAGLAGTPDGGWPDTADLSRRMDAVAVALAELFARASPAANPRGTGALRLWFVAESVALARRGGYSNPGANERDPLGHWSWATATMSPVAIIRDLAEKSTEQVPRLQPKADGEPLLFAAETMSRAASWCGSYRPAVAAHWAPVCESWLREGTEHLSARLGQVLRDTGALILGCGRQRRWQTRSTTDLFHDTYCRTESGGVAHTVSK